MTKRIYNFNPGPSTLPLSVLKIVQQELLDFKGTGMSIMEISHRSAEYDEVHNAAISLIRELMGLDDSFKVLFVGGGASTQFAYIPMNFLPEGRTAAYVDTGTWSSKAIKEAENLGSVHLAASSRASGYTYVPKPEDIDFPEDAAYLHLTSNNTIKGTQFHHFPDPGDVPLICDMSSDILSHQVDFSKFSMIYAGAQKNLGPSGVTVLIIRESMLEKCAAGLPTMIDYRTHASKNSLFNTPPSLTIYIVKLVLEWLKAQGGVPGIEAVNRQKKDLIYNLIDAYPDFFRGPVEKDSRSWMNIALRLPTEELEARFVAEAKAAGFVGLKGHRSVGGVRVSLYNAMTLEGAEKVADFMDTFRKANS
ncbi:MAG: 3-phosphoserine/phosphohydroxythreonine transaminase [FCB group bacterium]|nr:3-phosphoserine/phosphohydroxythreonine transaminase [FCB group bacterium]